MTSPNEQTSADLHPWFHPTLNPEFLERFRAHSEAVWDLAVEYDNWCDRPLDVGFGVNMAQNAYKFARLAQDAGAGVTLYTHPFDQSALSSPQWEEYDGEWPDLLDGPGFLAEHGNLDLDVRTVVPEMDDRGLEEARVALERGDRRPLVRFLSSRSGGRTEAGIWLSQAGLAPYQAWAERLAGHDVNFSLASPIPAYLAGKPYCTFSVGGDLQFDCGRGDAYGRATSVAFASSRFLLLGNPHPLAHCRRLGLENAVYLPYPMDDHRYCPGPGRARVEWEERFGPGPYVLTTARIDDNVKGNGRAILADLLHVARERPDVRFVFLGWGNNSEAFRERIATTGLGRNFVLLPPVGKKRLIDYYRSCDVVLDQFVFGYYGATGLEAAACGKPVVMRIREEHYRPLYAGDVAPVCNVTDPRRLAKTLLDLVDDPEARADYGGAMREWLVRTHGRRRTVPIMMALLRLAADHVPLDGLAPSPLTDPLTTEEIIYHEDCSVTTRVA